MKERLIVVRNQDTGTLIALVPAARRDVLVTVMASTRDEGVRSVGAADVEIHEDGLDVEVSV